MLPPPADSPKTVTRLWSLVSKVVESGNAELSMRAYRVATKEMDVLLNPLKGLSLICGEG